MNVSYERSYPTAVSNSTLLPLLLLSLARQRHAPHESKFIQDEYDYIVVGGGTAGSVVASRLSEEPCISVLLLEAGPSPPLLTEVPAFASSFMGTDCDWKFKTVPQRHAATALKNQQMQWATGKMLGGSGNHNGMAYVRGNHKNFDDWEDQGAKGWSFNDVFPYFLKLEDFRIPKFLYNGYHAVGGPITVELPRYDPPLKQALYRAGIELGYEFLDVNAERLTGFSDIQMNIRDGQRCSSVKGYLVPAENRTNFDILVNAMVTKVIIEDNRAVGVEFHRKGQLRVIKARREVIVSGGTANTPKILMLSGIGPREELEVLDIPVVADLPVGKNFHDHCGTQYFFTLNPEYRDHGQKVSDTKSIFEYIQSRSGPLASAGYLFNAFLRGSEVRPSIDFPNFNVFLAEMPSDLFKGDDVKPEVYKNFFKPHKNQSIFQCSPGTTQPKSRGTVTLSSSNPFDPPLIDPNYLEDPSDLKDIVEGLKVCQRLLNTAAMQALGAKPIKGELPGCENFSEDDDDYWRCYARSFVITTHHDVGTAKMGDAKDPTTVVDPELRVKNVEGLRVVDASIMPIVPTGNINIPVNMVAEKASDIIRNSIVC